MSGLDVGVLPDDCVIKFNPLFFELSRPDIEARLTLQRPDIGRIRRLPRSINQ